MPETTPVDQHIAIFDIPDLGQLRVAQITPNLDNQLQLTPYADGVSEVMHQAWHAKFVEAGILQPEDVANTLLNPYQQRKAINETYIERTVAARMGRESKAASYLVTSLTGSEPPTDASDIRAVLRMEPYRPAAPAAGNLRRAPYPKITGVETRSGSLLHDSRYRFDAFALLYAALRDANPRHKAAAYTERENSDGLDFFKALGFVDQNRDQRVRINQQPSADGGPAKPVFMTYAHMEARAAGQTQDTLRRYIGRYALPRLY